MLREDSKSVCFLGVSGSPCWVKVKGLGFWSLARLRSVLHLIHFLIHQPWPTLVQPSRSARSANFLCRPSAVGFSCAESKTTCMQLRQSAREEVQLKERSQQSIREARAGKTFCMSLHATALGNRPACLIGDPGKVGHHPPEDQVTWSPEGACTSMLWKSVTTFFDCGLKAEEVPVTSGSWLLSAMAGVPGRGARRDAL